MTCADLPSQSTSSGGRPRLNLAPRSADLPPPLPPPSNSSRASEASNEEKDLTLPVQRTTSRSNPFGDAKPVAVKETPVRWVSRLRGYQNQAETWGIVMISCWLEISQKLDNKSLRAALRIQCIRLWILRLVCFQEAVASQMHHLAMVCLCTKWSHMYYSCQYTESNKLSLPSVPESATIFALGNSILMLESPVCSTMGCFKYRLSTQSFLRFPAIPPSHLFLLETCMLLGPLQIALWVHSQNFCILCLLRNLLHDLISALGIFFGSANTARQSKSWAKGNQSDRGHDEQSSL